MLIGEDDISNDVITLGTCFFFNVCLHSRLFPLHTDWQKCDISVDGKPQGNWRWNSIPEMYLQGLLPFPAPPPECSVELARRLSTRKGS